MTNQEWPHIKVFELEQKHVGKHIRVDWQGVQSITGRLATLQFSHRHDFYRDGTKQLGDRECKVVLEIGSETLELQLPLAGGIAVEA